MTAIEFVHSFKHGFPLFPQSLHRATQSPACLHPPIRQRQKITQPGPVRQAQSLL
jgi:hypothetical protein